MRNLFASDTTPAAAADAAPGGWDGMKGTTKLLLGGGVVAGLIAAVVLPGMGKKEAAQLANQEPRPLSRITEYESPATVDYLKVPTTGTNGGTSGGTAPPVRRRVTPTEMALYATAAQPVAAAVRPALQGEAAGGGPGGISADPNDRLAQQLTGATTLPTMHATLVRNAEYTIRAGEVIPCLPIDALNSGRPGFTSCRVPEWYRACAAERNRKAA